MLHVVFVFLLFFEPRFSWRTTVVLSFAGVGTLLCVNVLAMLWQGPGIIMSIAFFTCTLPSMALFFLLSEYRDGRFFFLFCLSDTVCFWLLQVTNLLDRLAGGGYVVLLISRLVLFPLAEYIIWRYIRQPYRGLQRELDRGWWLFTVVGLTYYLLIMATAAPVDAPLPDAAGMLRLGLVMLLMPMTYFAILLSLWQQMRNYENVRMMEVQRQDYDALRQKMEVGRIYRHDMRHHLAAAEGLIQQKDYEGALHYIRSLSGGLEELTEPARCANPAVNAVLTAYIVQAVNAGCTVETDLRVPEKMPFEETDLCVILANALENAVHACQKEAEGQRRISLKVELTENRRLLIAVENSCTEQVFFGPDGLPDVPKREGHGLGLHSVKRVADKYGGIFRCQWDQGRFLLRAALIPPSDHEEPAEKPGPNWAALAILAALALLIVLNIFPALADALEAAPVLGWLVRAADLRTYALLFWRN